MTIVELAEKFAELKKKSEAQSDILKAINTEWSECEMELLEAMAEEGVKSLKTEFGTFSLTVTNYLSVNAAATETFYPYLKESGNGALLKEAVNSRTLTAFLKEHLETLIKEREATGLDPIQARESSLQFLNQKGASYFTKREIRMKK